MRGGFGAVPVVVPPQVESHRAACGQSCAYRVVIRHVSGRVHGAQSCEQAIAGTTCHRVHRAPGVHGRRCGRRHHGRRDRPNCQGRIRPLNVTGYLASIEECRQRFPGLRILSGVEAGESHLFGASAGAVVRGQAFDRVLGSLHAVPAPGRLGRRGRALRPRCPDGDAMLLLLRGARGAYRGQRLRSEVLAHLDLPKAGTGPRALHLYREEPARGGVPRVALRALAALRQGARDQHEIAAGLLST